MDLALHPECTLGAGALARIAEGRAREPDVTTVLARCNRAAERAVLRVLRRRGLRIPKRCWLVEATWWRRERLRVLGFTGPWGDRRTPDLAVVDPADGFRLVVLIEAKGEAWVNGGWGYCRLSDGDYSSQVSCYLHGCWVPEILRQEVADADHVWLTHDADADDPLHGRGLTKRAAWDPEWAAHYRRQQVSLGRWLVLDWQEIYDELVQVEGGRVVAAVILEWSPAGVALAA